MRIRTVKPAYWPHRMHSVISEGASLLGVALMNYADDEGRFEADPEVIRGQLFPRRNLSCGVDVALRELERVGYVKLYEAELDGVAVKLGLVVNLKRHQVINKPSKSTLPGPGRGGSGSFRECSGSDTGAGRDGSAIGGGSDPGGLPTEGRKEGREGNERKDGGMDGGESERESDGLRREECGRRNGEDGDGTGECRSVDSEAADRGAAKSCGAEVTRLVVRVPSEEECVAAGKGLGIEDGECRRFWAHYEAQATEGPNGERVWRRGGENGAVVTNWRALLSSWGRRTVKTSSSAMAGSAGAAAGGNGREPEWVTERARREKIRGLEVELGSHPKISRPGLKESDPGRWAEVVADYGLKREELRKLRTERAV